MTVALAVLVVVLLLVILVMGVRAGRTRPAAVDRLPPATVSDDRVVLTLDLAGFDADSPAIERVVDDAAWQAFASFPAAKVVEVCDREGRRLGTRTRDAGRTVTIPEDLYEPHLPRDHTPEPVSAGGERLPGVRREDLSAAAPGRPLLDRFDLPDGVAAAVTDPDDAVALVTALLEAGGHQVDADDDTVRVGDEVVIVIRAPIGEPLERDAVNHAYRRFQESGASRGVVVTPGFLDPRDARRREVLVPALRYAGPEGIQRMADSVAVGGDPLRFVAGTPLAG